VHRLGTVPTRIYVTSAEGHTGKSTIALGVLETLVREAGRVGVFRPIARSTSEPDYVLQMLLEHDTAELEYDDCIGVTYDQVHLDPDGALTEIVARFAAVERHCDAVVILGSDFTDVGSPTELSYNARIAANLGAPVLLVLGGRMSEGEGARTPDDMRQIAELTTAELREQHAGLLAVIVNRADPDQLEEIERAVADTLHAEHQVPVWSIPEDALLEAPTVGALLKATDARLLWGDPELLEHESLGVVVAAMSMENVLTRLTEGAIVVAPGDRADVLVGVLLAHASGTFPSLSGVILNGGFELAPQVQRLVSGIGTTLPIAMSSLGTYDTLRQITSTRGRLAAESTRKYDRARILFDEHVDAGDLLDRLRLSPSSVVTPLMFEYALLERARENPRHIVLPEGDDDRILQAAAILLQRKVARLTILGEEESVRARAAELGVDISDAEVVDPQEPLLRQRFAEEYARIRSARGITVEQASDTMADGSYFGTMMVHLGLADGMVSGAAHTTANTIRPAFEIIKTRPGVTVVSSVFLMALADRVLVDKVRAATALVRSRRPDLLVEGPIQYDAAADATVAAAKMPDSEVAGRATVFIFPDLNTGNNTYKAVQRSAGAVAIGPVLQGLNKPINDLSRGALVDDIVNTVAITAIQAAATPVAEPVEAEGPSTSSGTEES
jgi:phosphate acetyltransferase